MQIKDMLPTVSYSNIASYLKVNTADIIIYAAIVIVTLVGVFRCLLPLLGTTSALKRAVRRLQDEAGTKREPPVWQESRFMGKRLKNSWLRFLQNAEQLDRRGLPCNVEDYINDDTVAHGPGNATLAELIPGLLTSLGILGTFVGLTRGLSGLDMTDSAALMTGIPVLLNGMQTAFATSVAGVSCSLVFNMLNRVLQGRAYHAIDDFVSAFTQLAMQRPLDNDVQLICQNQDSNNMLFTMQDSLAGAVEVAVGRAMQPVSASLDNFLMTATRQQVEGLAHIVNSFVEQMNHSLSGQLTALGQTMMQVNSNQQGVLAAVENSLNRAGSITEDAERLHGISRDMMASFEHYMQELTMARSRDEHFEQSAGDLLQRMQAASQQQLAALNTIKGCQDQLQAGIADFRRASEESIGRMHQSDAAGAARMAEAGEQMNQASLALAHSYEGFVGNVVESVSRALGLFDESMTGMVNGLSEQLDRLAESGSTTEIIAKLGELQRLCASMEALLKKGA